MDDVLDNKGTLKFSTRTCWPRVQSDPFWPSVLHIFHWYKKQFSKDKRPSGPVKIIRGQTIQHTWDMTESFIIHERGLNSVSPRPEPLQVQPQHIRSTSCMSAFRYLWKWQWRRGEGGGGGYMDSKVTVWAGLAPKTTFLLLASFSLAKQLNGGGRGQGGGEVQTPSLDLPLYIIYTTSKEYFFATVGRNFWKCKFHNRATDRKIIIHRSVLKKRLYVEFTAVHVAQNSFFEFTVS